MTALCECGCGQPAPIADKTDSVRGYIAGKPRRFILGHIWNLKRSKHADEPIHLDPADLDLLDVRWTPVAGSTKRSTLYAMRARFQGRRHVKLHQVIAERMLGRELLISERVDHIDGNGLNNRRSNLRVVTQAENVANRTRHDRRNKSGVRGVDFDRRRNRWRAQATVAGKNTMIGRFATLQQAANAVHEWRLANMPGYIGHGGGL